MARVLTAELDRLADDLDAGAERLLRRVGQLLRAESLRVVREVKAQMPVRTGRARASWGIWTPQDIVREAPAAAAADAIWTFTVGGVAARVEQGTNVPYVEDLNAGHSRQAPAGFIDAAFSRGRDRLEAALGATLETLGTRPGALRARIERG